MSSGGPAEAAAQAAAVGADVLQTIAGFTSLPLTDERVQALAALVGGVRREHDSLRGLPQTVEPPIVFDPRWDG